MNDATDSRSFFSALFDFSFSSFVTTKIIKVLYALGIVGVTLWALTLIFGGIARGGMAAVLGLFGGLLAFFVGIIYVRVLLEFIIIVFRIAENTAVIAQSAQGGAPGGPAVGPGGGPGSSPPHGTGWGTPPGGSGAGGWGTPSGGPGAGGGPSGPGTGAPPGGDPGVPPAGPQGNG
jgi:hypothetical protein